MEWKQFEEKKIELPEIVISSMIAGFSNATKNLTDLVITPTNNLKRLTNKITTRFQFDVLLISEKLVDYKLAVFSFGYDVDIYPVQFVLSSTFIKNYNEHEWYLYEEPAYFNTEAVLKMEIEKIFNSEKFTEIVSGLMKIASAQK